MIEENNRGFKISVTRSVVYCLVIVCVYAKGVNREITNKAIVVKSGIHGLIVPFHLDWQPPGDGHKVLKVSFKIQGLRQTQHIFNSLNKLNQ